MTTTPPPIRTNASLASSQHDETVGNETTSYANGTTLPSTSNAQTNGTIKSTTTAGPTIAARPPPILCLGAARTGTASLSEALRILGYENVHHGMTMSPHDPTWKVLDRAADATFPILPTYTGQPFTREQWDEVIAPWDAVTDVFSFYATSLIPAYPDAPVILVEREMEAWLRSWDAQARPWYIALGHAFVRAVEPLTGSIAGAVCYKFITGWIGSNQRKDIFARAQEAYERHYAFVRANVPAERMLDFRLQDGWEPLCSFLSKPVPEVPFPRLNDIKAYRAKNRELTKSQLKIAARKVLHLEKSKKGRSIDGAMT